MSDGKTDGDGLLHDRPKPLNEERLIKATPIKKPPSSNPRDAIIRALYAERSHLIDRQLLGRLEDDDRTRLEGITDEIERLEILEMIDAKHRRKGKDS